MSLKDEMHVVVKQENGLVWRWHLILEIRSVLHYRLEFFGTRF